LHAEIAAGFYERGQMEVALQELDEAVKLDAKNAKIYNVYGLVYAVLGQDANAERNFQQAIALAPTDSEIRQNWGWYLCTHGRPRESIPEFETRSGIRVQEPRHRADQCRASARSRPGTPARRGFPQARGDHQSVERLRCVQPGAPHVPGVAHRRGAHADAADHGRAEPAPDALYLGMCIERKASDRVTEASYVQQLKTRYPTPRKRRPFRPARASEPP
jgi:type IV pilus assembly protein PilF